MAHPEDKAEHERLERDARPEETNLYEAIHAIREGIFYEDYDYAAGPGLRILVEAMDAMVEFCEFCERGEIRSKKTYAKFCKILARIPNPMLR